MLLSICIPIYNSDIRPIASELHRQIQAYSSEVELLFLDDASDVFFKELNRSVGRICDYQELATNIGRSKIRNAFLPFAKGTYLLFIDGDSKIIQSDFIERYVERLRSKNTEVLIGASVYSDEKPDRAQLLRWTYSRKRESKSFTERNRHPELGFKSNNFVILKSIFETHQFDESLTTYGHEDTLFGYQLRQDGVKFEHIENPVLNAHLDENQHFLEKTKEALQNLLLISFKIKDSQFHQQQKLVRLAMSISKMQVIRFIFHVFGQVFQPMLSFLLTNGFFRLWMFDLYRLIELERIIGKDIADK
jgi:glycosyltransferase involved in cell wall biosynthesis